jgi:hypothetical protein
MRVPQSFAQFANDWVLDCHTRNLETGITLMTCPLLSLT